MFFHVFTAFAVAQIFSAATAQTSSVVCLASYDWARNSLGQNPCVVSAYLLRPCSSSNIDVPVLPPGEHYVPGDTSECNCNSIVYSLVSACADCQGRLYSTWFTWSENCTGVYGAIYPRLIPAGTAIPAWAYLDVQTTGMYDPAAAMNTTGPESSASPIPLSTGAAASSAPRRLRRQH